jgi:hypothetical protein
MTGFGAGAAPCCPSSLGYRGVGTARIGKIAAERGGRWPPSVLSRRNRLPSGECRLKQFRRIATRYEKRAANYAAMLTIGMVLLWL